MFNILPVEEKLRIHREYTTRFLVSFFALSFVSLIIALILLLSSHLLVGSILVETEGDMKIKTNCREATEAESCSEEINSVASQLKALSIDSGLSSSEIIEAVLGSRPTSGIRIFNLTVEDSKEGGLVSVSGRATDRASLLGFQKNLKEGGVFSKVEIPISNFAKESQIDFEIRLATEY